MAKKSTTTKKAPKATESAKAATVQVKKDAKGRFWVVPKDGSAEQAPYARKNAAFDVKVDAPAPKTKAAKPVKTKEPNEKKLSAIDAAAQVLAASKEPLNAKEMVEQMAAQRLWTSPGGKTPHATLYSAIIREISVKGKESRFTKTERGKFAAK